MPLISKAAQAAAPPPSAANLGFLKDMPEAFDFIDVWRFATPTYDASAPVELQQQLMLIRAANVLPRLGQAWRNRTPAQVVVQARCLEAHFGAARVHVPPAGHAAELLCGAAEEDLVPPDNVCVACGASLRVEQQDAQVVVETEEGPFRAKVYRKVCTDGRCGCVHYYNETKKRGEAAVFRAEVLQQPYLRVTQRRAFCTRFLDKVSNLMERCQVSFDGIAAATRANWRSLDNTIERLDRQTLSQAWFTRAALEACIEAGLIWPTPADLHDRHRPTIRRIYHEYRVHFRKCNLMGHTARCLRPGRCRTGTLDGIQLCTFKCKTAIRHYKLLQGWGQLPQGCTNPPRAGSAYCGECLMAGGLRTPQGSDPEFDPPKARAAAKRSAPPSPEGDDEPASDPLREREEALLQPINEEEEEGSTPPTQAQPQVQDMAARNVRASTAAQRVSADSFMALFDEMGALKPLTKGSVADGGGGDDGRGGRAGASGGGSADVGAAAACSRTRDDEGCDDGGAQKALNRHTDAHTYSAPAVCACADDEVSFSRRWLEEKGSDHRPIKSDVFIVEALLRQGKDALGLPIFEVKWVGWKHPTWEPANHIPPTMRTAFEAGESVGLAAEHPNLLRDPSVELLELTSLELELYGDKQKCSTLKEEQERLQKYPNKQQHGHRKEHAGQVLATDAGQSVFTWACNGIGDLEPMYRKESIGNLIHQIGKIDRDCPGIIPAEDKSVTRALTPQELVVRAKATLADPMRRKELVAIYYDDACHFKYSVLLRAVGRLASSATGEAGALYRRLALLIISCDRLHFEGHVKTDGFCVRNCNPEFYDEVIAEMNSMVAEQTFRWMEQFGNIVRTMGQERAYFFLIRMCERHNRRIISDTIMGLDAKKARLWELCAAYRYAPSAGETPLETKRAMIDRLIAGQHPYDLAELDAYVAVHSPMWASV